MASEIDPKLTATPADAGRVTGAPSRRDDDGAFASDQSRREDPLPSGDGGDDSGGGPAGRAAGSQGRTDVPLSFLHRTVAVVVVITAAVGLILLLWFQIHVLLLGFAGVLLAVFLYTISEWAWERLKVKYWLALTILCILLIGLPVGMGFLSGERMAEEFQQLRQRIPESLDHVQDYLAHRTWGKWVLARLQSRVGAAGETVGRSGVNVAVQYATEAFVVAFVGLFGAINPVLYVGGFLRLLPDERRRRIAREVITGLRWSLWWWLVAQLLSMVFIGVITWIVVWALGVPLALTLGVLAALLNFIPNFGPLVAAIPAVLMGLLQGPLVALWIALAYTGIQLLQNHVVTPLVQQRVANLPPIILLLSQLFMYYWDGVLGMIMAPPLALVVIRLVQMLYLDQWPEPAREEHDRHTAPPHHPLGGASEAGSPAAGASP